MSQAENLFNFMRDPMWQFIGVVIALVALVVAITAIVIQLRRKNLSYEVVNIPLLTVEEEIAGILRILYDEQPVRDVRLIKIRLVNSGQLPITPEEYIEPITVDFGEEAKILSVDVFEKNPPDIHGTSTRDGGKVTFSPVLLNSGDFLSIKMLVSHFKTSPVVSARIVGIKRIRQAKDSQANMWLASFGLIIMVGGFLISFRSRPGPRPPVRAAEIWGLGTALIGNFTMAFGLLGRRGLLRLAKFIRASS